MTDADAALKAVDSAQNFVVASAISTNAIVTWRDAQFGPRELEGEQVEAGTALQVRLGETPLTLSPIREFHAGHLLGSVKLLGMFEAEQWSARFILTYHKAMMYLATPALAALDLFEDAYIGFFRCLEYVTMSHVLGGQRGQFNEQHLVRAFTAIGIKAEGADPDNEARKLGQKLIRRRGHAAAHLGHAASSDSIQAQEVFELKAIIDFMITQRLKAREAARTAQAPVTSDAGG